MPISGATRVRQKVAEWLSAPEPLSCRHLIEFESLETKVLLSHSGPLDPAGVKSSAALIASTKPVASFKAASAALLAGDTPVKVGSLQDTEVFTTDRPAKSARVSFSTTGSDPATSWSLTLWDSRHREAGLIRLPAKTSRLTFDVASARGATLRSLAVTVTATPPPAGGPVGHYQLNVTPYLAAGSGFQFSPVSTDGEISWTILPDELPGEAGTATTGPHLPRVARNATPPAGAADTSVSLVSAGDQSPTVRPEGLRWSLSAGGEPGDRLAEQTTGEAPGTPEEHAGLLLADLTLPDSLGTVDIKRGLVDSPGGPEAFEAGSLDRVRAAGLSPSDAYGPTLTDLERAGGGARHSEATLGASAQQATVVTVLSTALIVPNLLVMTWSRTHRGRPRMKGKAGAQRVTPG